MVAPEYQTILCLTGARDDEGNACDEWNYETCTNTWTPVKSSSPLTSMSVLRYFTSWIPPSHQCQSTEGILHHNINHNRTLVPSILLQIS